MSEPEASERWPITRCREALWEVACQVLLLREELASLKAVLPLADDLDEQLEQKKPYDIPTNMLTTVETVVANFLAPAQAALEKSASATEERLGVEFEEEARKWRP
jgi:hypothetical protein